VREVEILKGSREGATGIFHGFFQCGNLEHGCDPVAVVEVDGGRCEEFSSSYIRFINPPAKELVEG